MVARLVGSQVASFVLAVAAGALFAVDTHSPAGFWIHSLLIAVAFVSLGLAIFYLYRELVSHRRFTIQGEHIPGYEACGFGRKDDPQDETGCSIVNLRKQWRLSGKIGTLGRAGSYLINLRFKMLRHVPNGSFKMSVCQADRVYATRSLSTEDIPLNEYTYVDLLFDYDGASEVVFVFEPDAAATVSDLVSVDRIEAYHLPKANISRE